VAHGFFQQVVAQARAQGLLSAEHFTVDGTLIEVWAGHKSFKRTDAPSQNPPDDPRNPSVDFHGERRTNATHQSTSDPQARLYKKAGGQEAAKLCYLGHLLMENRNGLLVNTKLTPATGRAEREAALTMAAELLGWGPVTLGANKALRCPRAGAGLARSPRHPARRAEAAERESTAALAATPATG
jgi:hypothetical protein